MKIIEIMKENRRWMHSGLVGVTIGRYQDSSPAAQNDDEEGKHVTSAAERYIKLIARRAIPSPLNLLNLLNPLNLSRSAAPMAIPQPLVQRPV